VRCLSVSLSTFTIKEQTSQSQHTLTNDLFCNAAYKPPRHGNKTMAPLTRPSYMASPVTSEERCLGVKDAMVLIYFVVLDRRREELPGGGLCTTGTCGEQDTVGGDRCIAISSSSSSKLRQTKVSVTRSVPLSRESRGRDVVCTALRSSSTPLPQKDVHVVSPTAHAV